MRDQLKRLEELQRHDAKIQELQTALAAIPAKLKANENDLARVEALLTQERAQVAEAQRYHAEQRGLVDTDSAHVTGAKSKLSQAKNPREFSAAQREIEQTRESLANREAEIGKLVDAMAAKEKLLNDRAGEVQALREAMNKDAEAAQERVAELEKELAELKRERDQVAAGVRPDFLKRYSTIRMRRGIAIAAVRGGACSACNMNLPPQLNNIVQRGTSVETCPYCHRIIYWEQLMKDPAPAEGTPGGNADGAARA